MRFHHSATNCETTRPRFFIYLNTAELIMYLSFLYVFFFRWFLVVFFPLTLFPSSLFFSLFLVFVLPIASLQTKRADCGINTQPFPPQPT